MGKGAAKRKEVDIESDYSSVEDSEGDKSLESSSSSSSSESESEDDRAPSPSKPAKGLETIKYTPMKLQMMGRPFSPEALKDEDNELWLVRIPRYDAFVKALGDRDIQVVDGKESKEIQGGKIAGSLKGYYVFRDYGEVKESERAVFVTKDGKGEEKMEIAKPFARSVQVTFDAPLKSQSHKGPPPRTYPVAPEGLTLKYRPIGSETASAPKTTNGSMFVRSPIRKRKLSDMNMTERPKPSTPELRRQSAVPTSPARKRKHSDRKAGEETAPSTPEQKSPSRRTGASTPEQKSPSRRGSLAVDGSGSPHQGSRKSPRRKKSESRRRGKHELT